MKNGRPEIGHEQLQERQRHLICWPCMDQEQWPDIVIAVLASLVLIGLPGLVITLAVLG